MLTAAETRDIGRHLDSNSSIELQAQSRSVARINNLVFTASTATITCAKGGDFDGHKQEGLALDPL